jgi:hypothetical protein
MVEDTPSTYEVNARPRRTLALIAGIVSALVILLIAVVVYFFIRGRGLFGFSKADATIQAMPQDTSMYVHVALANLTCEKTNPIVWAFSEDWKREEKCGLEELIVELDEELEADMGFTFSEDIKPWVGESVGFGILDLTLDDWGGVEDMELLLALEVRDPSAADEFLITFKERLAEQDEVPFLEEAYEGRTLYFLDSDWESERTAFTRSEDLVLLSQDISTLKKAIDSQEGESLGDDEIYQEAINALREGRTLTFYYDLQNLMTSFSDLFYGMYGMDPTGLSTGTFEAIQAIAGGFSIIEEGVQLDAVTLFDSENLTDSMRGLLSIREDPAGTTSLLPEDTFLLLAGEGLDKSIVGLKENLMSMSEGEDIEESLEMLEFTLGFDPFEEFFPRLDGELAIAVTQEFEGSFMEAIEVPLGFTILSETSDADGLLVTLQKLSDFLEQEGLGEVEESQSDVVNLFELVDYFSGDSILSYGVSETYFALCTSKSSLIDLFDGGRSLADSDRYQQVWEAFPGDMVPVWYLDVEGLVGTIRESMPPDEREYFEEDMGAFVKPIQFFAVAVAPLDGEMMRSSAILFIETE